MKASQRVLHIAHGIPSYNNSLIELTKRLSAMQIELQVVSHVDLSAVLADSSASFVLLTAGKDLSKECGEAPSDSDTGKGNWFTKALKRVESNQKHRQCSIENSELKDCIASWKPDLLLIDMECHVAIVQSLSLGIKIILSSRWFSVFRSAGVPPMHTLLSPSKSWFQSCRITWVWVSLWLRKFAIDLNHRFSRRRFWPIGD